jgi:hypothetical protein
MKDEKTISQIGRGCWKCHKNPLRVCTQWTHISLNWNSLMISEFLVSQTTKFEMVSSSKI